MQDIEALKEAQARTLLVAIEENRIFSELPIPPKRVGFGLSLMPWVTYEVDELSDALDIFKAYTPEPWVLAKDGGCTVFNTWGYIEAKYNKKGPAHTSSWRPYEVEYSIEDGAPYFDCTQGVGHGGTEMEFFTHAAGVLLKIIVRIKFCPIYVRLIPVHPGVHREGKLYRKEYPNVPGAKCVHWGYGENCAKGSYWFGDLTQFWSSMQTYLPDLVVPE